MAVSGEGAREDSARARRGRWLRFARPHRGAICLCAALLFAETAVALAIPLFAGDLARSYLAGGGAVVGAIALVLVLLVLARAVMGATGHYLLDAVAEDVGADLRLALYRHLHAVPVRFHERRSRAELLSILTEDTATASRVGVHALIASLPLLALCTGACAMLVHLAPGIGAVAAVVLPLLVVLGRLIARRARPLVGVARQLRADGAALADAHLRVLRTAKAFGAESELVRHFDEHRRQARYAGKRAALATALLEPGRAGVAAVAGALVIWAMAGDLGGRSIDPGGMVAFLLYGLLLVRPVGRLLALYGDLQPGRLAMQRVDSVLTEPVERGGDYAPPVGTVKGRVVLREVCFGYPGRPDLISLVSLDAEPGEVVAITGPNGVGKTTLLHLVMGYMRPSAGSIWLDGVDTREWNLVEMRRCLSLVPHEVEFLPVTVRSNITLGADERDAARLDWALDVSIAREVVNGLPGGLDARLGPSGQVLSAGQAQRLALARALYRRTPVLLLDEPTSMFDEHAETAFVRRARSELRNTTVLLVTHRSQTLALADRVLRLGAGPVEPSSRTGKVIQGPWAGS